MVDANGKRYESRVNNVAEKDDAGEQPEPQYEEAHIGAVANLSPYHHLNWKAALSKLQNRAAPRRPLLMP